ncbi:DUF2637 domain-containing protein [Streptomyces sp. DSM 44917]|uniref:DUF2637 domain-containing protein n=1 Tax=Streptomyces boetiae TaxID=3075541 RepID=A0ABU2L4K8_9ACTN|nr:DUF2637 domain-containing protein [Streptomyces sp. DSM 44917]MDT0306307.1 DUF2637 domain-containing protein [Streptomyces sp. DSM 44917]
MFNQRMIYDPSASMRLFLPPETTSEQTARLTGLRDLLDASAPPPPPEAEDRPLRGHRRARRRPAWAGQAARAQWLRCASLVLAAAAALLVAMLSVLGGLISYPPLRASAAPGVTGALRAWWPLLIYGPWLVASLSILRAALHQRHARHAWAVVVLFSGLAVCLCAAQAPPTPSGVATAGLPPVSALVAFHQIVRQMTLINPPRHAVLPRRHARTLRR